MIPTNIQYSLNIKKKFSNEVEWFSTFLRKYSDESSKARQLLILSTEEFHKYLDIVKSISSEVVNAFGHSCAYCDSKDIVSVLPLHPLEKNRDFPELAQEIRNLVPFCSQCRKILTIFKYQAHGIHESGDFDKLILKRPNVLVPIQEPTHLYLEYKLNGEVLGKTAEAKRTLKICGINEINRIKERKSQLNIKVEEATRDEEINYLKLWQAFKGDKTNWWDGYKSAVEIEKKHTEIFETNQLQLMEGITYYRDDCVPILPSFIKEEEPIDLECFEFNNLRNIKDAKVTLSGKKALAIIGENGVGKSTFLDFFSTVMRGTRIGQIKHSSDGFISHSLSKTMGLLSGTSENEGFLNQAISVRSSANVFLCEAEIQKKLRLAFITDQRINSKNIKSAENWLLTLSEEQFDVVSSQLKQILDIEYDSILVRNGEKVLVSGDNSSLKELSTLSSGYKSILTIVYSIYRQFGSSYKLSSEYVNLDSIVGAVFIDEIDLHLHPIWKINIVSRLKRVFPDVLFVFTTHDPLILKGCDLGEVILLSRASDGMTLLSQDLPDLSKYSAERILTSRYFGLGSSSNIEDNHDLRELYKSINNQNESSPTEEVKRLKLNGLYGNTYREMVAFMCVDKSIATGKPIDIDEIVQTINNKVSNHD